MPGASIGLRMTWQLCRTVPSHRYGSASGLGTFESPIGEYSNAVLTCARSAINIIEILDFTRAVIRSLLPPVINHEATHSTDTRCMALR